MRGAPIQTNDVHIFFCIHSLKQLKQMLRFRRQKWFLLVPLTASTVRVTPNLLQQRQFFATASQFSSSALRASTT